MPGRRRPGPRWPGPRWRGRRSGGRSASVSAAASRSMSSGAGSTPVSSPSRVSRRRLVSGMTPGMIGMVTPARRARVMQVRVLLGVEEDLGDGEVGAGALLGQQHLDVVGLTGRFRVPGGVRGDADGHLAGAQQRRTALLHAADEFDQVLGVAQRPLARGRRRPWAGRRAAPGCRARRRRAVRR